jgi:hypothetical protein
MFMRPVSSPCIAVCELDTDTGFCRGCLRSANEIAIWRDADSLTRRLILRRIEQRRASGLTTVAEPSRQRRQV